MFGSFARNSGLDIRRIGIRRIGLWGSGRDFSLTFQGEGRNRERAHVFLLVEDRRLAGFRIDPDEVGGLVEIAVADLLYLLHGR